MPKVTVRKCPITRKVFFGDDEYATHIVALRERRNLERVHIRYRKESQDRVWNIIENEIDTIPRLSQFVIDNLHDILIAYNGGRPEVNEAIRESKLEGFSMVLRYTECISNSHDCPRNGVKNWAGNDDDKPHHYPGFTGQISFKLKNNPEHDKRMDNGKLRTSLRFTDALGYIGIHTGSGGGGDTMSYDIRLFQDDFPALRRTVFKAKLEDGSIDKAALTVKR